MTKNNVLRPLARANAFVAAAVIAGSALLPAILLQGSASGATIENRFIDMSSALSSTPSSNGSGRDGGDAFGQSVTYTVGFDMPSTGNVGAIVVEFCSNSPIYLDSCTAPTGMDVDTGTAVANQNGISGFTKVGAAIVPAANRFGIENGTAQSITSNTADTSTVDGITTYPNADVKFDITGITNPTTLGSFYARVYVYSANTNLPGTAWDATATGATGVGTPVHDGGYALATANELTITARVQEVLEFCVGTDTDSSLANAAADDCGDVTGTDLSLGVVDSNSVSKTSTIAVPNDGVFLIRTNALNGASVFYKSEQDTSSGKLKQTGATCSGVSLADACFNSAGTTQVDIDTLNAGDSSTERFGMTLRDLNTTSGGATTALSCTADYDGDGSCGTGAVTGYAWDDTGSFDTLVSATGPIDDEKASIEFAATAAPTTPTGLYTVTANFVATSIF